MKIVNDNTFPSRTPLYMVISSERAGYSFWFTLICIEANEYIAFIGR